MTAEPSFLGGWDRVLLSSVAAASKSCPRRYNRQRKRFRQDSCRRLWKNRWRKFSKVDQTTDSMKNKIAVIILFIPLLVCGLLLSNSPMRIGIGVVVQTTVSPSPNAGKAMV